MKATWTRRRAGAGAVTVACASLIWIAAHRMPAVQGVVIITLDTTRADRLSPYGYMNVSLPNLERLAREGVVFDQAQTVAPLTLTAHTSLFTGLLPPNHGVRDNADRPLADTHTTLAAVLQGRGFRTGAFVASVVLDPDRGLQQGFEQYRGVPKTGGDGPEGRQRRADAVMDDAIAWLDTIQESRFLLWTHLYDAHRPYDPPEPYRTEYGHNLYVGEIAFADSQVGRLLAALETRHLLDRTLVIVTADHGESLGDHGERDHGIFLYQDVLHIPLIVRAPGLLARHVPDLVQLTDVMPTALELLDVAAPPVDGQSLVGLMTGHVRDRELDAYSESLYPERLGWSPLRALRRGEYTFIQAPRPELYDLAGDPFEQQNLYDTERVVADAMAARLAEILNAFRSPAHSEPANATTDLQARLGALGYLASTGAGPSTNPAALPDPKDCIAFFATSERRPWGSPCAPVRLHTPPH